MITDFDVTCPYCGEVFNALVDYSPLFANGNNIDSNSTDDYTYIEDCQVCCQAILFTPIINENSELIDVITRQENE